MPSDETRRTLKVFGVAVTNLEDAETVEERSRCEVELEARLRELEALIDRLRARRP